MKARILWLLTVLVVVGAGNLPGREPGQPAKPDFEKLGGTILTYEVVTDDKKDVADLSALLAAALQRRLDPNKQGLAVVLPVGKDRVEIRVPGLGDLSVEEVNRIKDLVSRVGNLEFCMLANNVDDREGQKAAADYINSEANKQDLVQSQKDGLPPPGPMTSDKKPRQFEIFLPKNNKSLLTYSWVELGPQERKQLGLHNDAEFQVESNEIWREAKKNRDKATELKDSTGVPLLQGALFYSRECLNRNLPEMERRAKRVDYFVLARNPEIDLSDPLKRETPRISGKYIERADVSTELTPTCNFRFNRPVPSCSAISPARTSLSRRPTLWL